MGRILRLPSWLSRFWKNATAELRLSARAEWRRDTALKQGAVLPDDVVRDLGLGRETSGAAPLAVIISHDCDLVTSPEDEPFVELAMGTPIKASQSGCTYAQSTFKLHIEFEFNGAAYPVEFCALDKRSVAKTKLIGVGPDERYELSDDGVQVLQAWLAARYRRASFPDALVDRLKPMRNKFANIGKKAPAAIIGLWLRFEPQDNKLSDDVPYELWVYIVYSTRVVGARALAEEAAAKLRLDFEKGFKANSVWRLVDLRDCRAVSETEFTLFDLLQTSQWRLEYISMRESPPGEVV